MSKFTPKMFYEIDSWLLDEQKKIAIRKNASLLQLLLKKIQ